MTADPATSYCRPRMEQWQTGAFVVQFRPETDIAAGRLEGRVEHIASYRAKRFSSLEELLAFVAGILSDVKSNDRG